MTLGNRKLVVLGIPWDVDTEGLRRYMCQFGDLEDVIVMKDRVSRQSRGFGYVTFSSYEGAQKAMAGQHVLQGRTLEVKIATPKDEMRPTSRKITRIFVARISPTVTDEMFRSYFEKYGSILDAYMPKDQTTKQHRGIGFVTYENAESVDKVMSESHELAGSTIAVDRATPKIAVDHASPLDETPGLGVCAPYGLGKKIFIGRIPLEATTEDLRLYFSQYGHILDVYIPKDAKKISHRGFGFVTFAEESTAEHVAQKTHEILGHRIAVDRAAPLDEARSGLKPSNALFGGAGGPLRGSSSSISQSAYENMPANLAFNSGWTPYFGVGHVAASGGGTSGHQTSRMETRYRPY